MADQSAAAVTETPAAPAPAAAAEPAIDLEAFGSLLNLPPGKPKTEEKPAAGTETKAGAEKKTKEPEHLAAANGRKPPKEPLDPLNEHDFDAEQLKTPEALKAAAERIQKARRQALDLIRSSHNAIAQAERLKRQHTEKDRTLTERETRVAAWERLVSTAVDDLESGDSERFLTAVGKLSKSGDPAGFWRNAALSLAKGEKLKPAQAAQAAADPELKQRLEALERHLSGQADAEYNAQVEQLKTRNLEAAKGNAETPRVVAYATDPRAADAIRERLAEIMVAGAKEKGRPLTVAEACASLEDELSVHFELSQRADDKTNGEKGTAASGAEAGRETSKDPPKPETTPATIPASLTSAPVASGNRQMTEAEEREWQIRQAEAIGFL